MQSSTMAAPAPAPLSAALLLLDPKPVDQIGFDDLIAPVTREEFFADYWEKAPLVSRGRPAEFFVPLFSLRDVDRAIHYFRPRPGRLDLVSEHGFVRENFLNSDGTANLNLVR